MKKTPSPPRTAKAVITLDQITHLIEGEPITFRFPERDSSPRLELELVREPLGDGVHFTYTLYGKSGDGSYMSRSTVSETLLDMSFMDKAFRGLHSVFEDLRKGMDQIFRLPQSK
jgi:hypothetical protein